MEYSIKALWGMTVSQLRRCMNDEAGVFFDPKDVVEKEDMIRIFLMSGRLSVIPEPDEEGNEKEDKNDEEDAKPVARVDDRHDDLEGKPPAVPQHGPIVETVTNDDIMEIDERTNRDLVMEETGYENDGVLPQGSTNAGTADPSPSADGSTISEENQSPKPECQDMDDTVEDNNQSPEPDNCEVDDTNTGTVETVGAAHHSERMRSFEVDSQDDSVVAGSPGDASEPTDTPVEGVSRSLSADDESHRGRKRPLQASPARAKSADGEAVRSRFDSLSVSELRDMGRSMSIDLSDCIERIDIHSAPRKFSKS